MHTLKDNCHDTHSMLLTFKNLLEQGKFSKDIFIAENYGNSFLGYFINGFRRERFSINNKFLNVIKILVLIRIIKTLLSKWLLASKTLQECIYLLEKCQNVYNKYKT